MALAITNGEVILIIFFATLPIAALAFALGAGKALSQVGKGQFAIDEDQGQKAGGGAPPSREVREAEIRQLLEAKAYRQRQRGQTPLDVDAELEKILAEEAGGDLGSDPQLVEEVRQLVVARNERRLRKGQEPLEVEAEIERQLRDLENLGQ
jgi:hypothetical protein